MFKLILGLLLIVAGILVGLWAGIWWAFIGGIVQVIEQIRAPHLDAMQVALGVARIFFAGPAAIALILPGGALIASAK